MNAVVLIPFNDLKSLERVEMGPHSPQPPGEPHSGHAFALECLDFRNSFFLRLCCDALHGACPE